MSWKSAVIIGVVLAFLAGLGAVLGGTGNVLSGGRPPPRSGRGSCRRRARTGTGVHQTTPGICAADGRSRIGLPVAREGTGREPRYEIAGPGPSQIRRDQEQRGRTQRIAFSHKATKGNHEISLQPLWRCVFVRDPLFIWQSESYERA